MNKERNAFQKLNESTKKMKNNPSGTTEQREHIFSKIKSNTQRVSFPIIFSPPKVIGQPIKKMKQKEVITSNSQGNELIGTHASTENNDTGETKNQFNSVEQEESISNTIKELLNSQQSNHPGEEAAKETVLLEEDIDLKSVNELLLRVDGLIKKGPELKESSSIENNSSALPEQSSSADNEPASILEKHSSVEDDSSLIDDKFSSLLGKISKILEESSSLEDGLEEEFFKGKDGEDRHHRKLQKSDLQQCNCSYKENRILIRLPVLLSTVNIDIDIFDSFDLFIPISSVSKIDWSLHFLENRVLLHSTIVFFKGKLVANIEYENEENSVHNIKVQVPWEKATSIKWVYPPIMPSSSRMEYTFQSNNWIENSYHYEYQEQFADSIQHTLRSINFIWNEELDSQLSTSKLFIQGTANLCIDLLQEQYIELNTL